MKSERKNDNSTIQLSCTNMHIFKKCQRKLSTENVFKSHTTRKSSHEIKYQKLDENFL